MLILTRRVGDSIVISNGIYCTILGYEGDQVKLCFDAPLFVPINRYEIHRRIFQNKSVGNYEEIHNIDEVVVERLIEQLKKVANH